MLALELATHGCKSLLCYVLAVWLQARDCLYGASFFTSVWIADLEDTVLIHLAPHYSINCNGARHLTECLCPFTACCFQLAQKLQDCGRLRRTELLICHVALSKPLHLYKPLSSLAQQLMVPVLLPPWIEDNGGKVLWNASHTYKVLLS